MKKEKQEMLQALKERKNALFNDTLKEIEKLFKEKNTDTLNCESHVLVYTGVGTIEITTTKVMMDECDDFKIIDDEGDDWTFGNLESGQELFILEDLLYDNDFNN